MVCEGKEIGLCFLKGRREEECWWMACEEKEVRSGL